MSMRVVAETKIDLKVPSDSQMAQLADYVSFLEN